MACGTLFAKYELTGWREPFARLQQELADYDTWVRASVMPKARSDSRMRPEQYAFSLQSYGIDLPPAQLAAQAHAAFTGIQSEMAPIAAEVAKQHGWPSSDYRDVVRQMKKTQIAGDTVLPFYQARLKAIEEIVVAKDLLTLPTVRPSSASPPRPKPARRRCLPRISSLLRQCTTLDRRQSLSCR